MSDSIVQMAMTAHTRSDVEQLETALRTRLHGPKIRYLGDKEANWSEISSPADPTALIFERVTNMWDAVLELFARRAGSAPSWASPTEAAAALLQVDGGPSQLPSNRRDELARHAVVTLHDSDDSKAFPTLSFRDQGIGLTASEMPTTILSIAESNKLRKPYMHGIFGKGGSSASVFSDATVILTRKQPDLLAPEQEDRISIAVIKEDDAPDVGLPFFRYYVGSDRLPLSVPAADQPSFEPGTLVIHVNYHAGNMGVQQWRFEQSIYAQAETLLFKPTLPYSLHDDRSEAYNTRPMARRKPSTLSGLAQRLDNRTADGLKGRSSWTTIGVPEVGQLKARWWLYDSEDNRRLSAAKGHAVIFTTNGQVHHTWDQARLRVLVPTLRRVSGRLLCEVDCDGVELKRRVKVFDTFRTQVRKGPEGRAVEGAIARVLADDPDLAEHETRFIRESLQSSTQKVSDKLLQRLNNAVRAKGAGLTPVTPTRPKPPNPRPAAELYEEPTTFTGPETVTAGLGTTVTIFFEMNAVDGFVPERGTITITPDAGAPELSLSIGDLRRGRLRVGANIPEDADLGVIQLDATLEWRRREGGVASIPWMTKLEVVAEVKPKTSKPSKKKARKRKRPAGDLAFIWSTPDEQGEPWDDLTVGEVHEVEGSVLASQFPESYGDLKGVKGQIPTVVLNSEFRDWARYKKASIRKTTDSASDQREERYGIAVGSVVANFDALERKLRKRWEARDTAAGGAGDPDRPMTPEQFQRALAEAARGVIALMPDFDALVGDGPG